MGDIMSLQGSIFPSIGFVQFEIEAADPERNIKRIEEELSKVNPHLHALVKHDCLLVHRGILPFYGKEAYLNM